MSYADDVPPLDFAGMHTVCLSGENGNGKSALLDAITWSLWGESRAGKNRHDELVRIGADEMSVQFTFEMDGLVYRVMRKRSKRAGGNQWELNQRTSDGGWRSLTGNNAGETEKAILKLLRMSYDTFLNAAYLRQGQADQFVKQPPGKRKEILADILDLSRYDQLETKARERCREAELDVIDTERDINAIDVELASEEAHRQSLAAKQMEVGELVAMQNLLAAEIDSFNKTIGELQARKAQADTRVAQAAALDKEITELQRHLAELSLEQGRHEKLLADRESIEQRHKELLAARAEFERLEEQLKRYNVGRRKVAEVEGEYNAKRTRLVADIDNQTRRLADKEASLKDLPRLKQEHAAITARLGKIENLTAECQKLTAEKAAVDQRFHKLELENLSISQHIKDWDNRLTELAKQQGVCLVCNAPLPPERAAAVKAEYEANRAALIERRAELRAEGTAVKDENNKRDAEIKSLERQIADGGVADRLLLGQIGQRVKDLDTSRLEIPTLRQSLDDLRVALERETFALEIKARLDDYKARLKEIELVPVEHAAAKARLTELDPAERVFHDLGHAQEALDRVLASRKREEEALQGRCKSRSDLDAEIAAAEGVAAALADTLSQCAAKQNELTSLQSAERLVGQEIGRFTELINRCEARRTERIAKDAKLKEARKDHEVYDQLARAFGKKGVQALIIENAIPEIRDETNDLLERLTDGDMSISFETLREARTKREGPIETLDIKVSDSLGTRPLEMYSGGEGFRVAFALRIALSRLLARRAGARLQTLIIDEGFGTQDAKGREKLVDALNAIKDDFEKIIVITHIDELKDAFATRIEVTKTPRGSQITVMEGAAG